LDVIEHRRDQLGRTRLVDAFDGLRGAIPDPLAEGDSGHRIARHSGQGSELLIEFSALLFERTTDDGRIHVNLV
jgi:hypothetical protein